MILFRRPFLATILLFGLPLFVIGFWNGPGGWLLSSGGRGPRTPERCLLGIALGFQESDLKGIRKRSADIGVRDPLMTRRPPLANCILGYSCPTQRGILKFERLRRPLIWVLFWAMFFLLRSVNKSKHKGVIAWSRTLDGWKWSCLGWGFCWRGTWWWTSMMCIIVIKLYES